MAIQWFPGHMNTTRRAISDRMKDGIDVVIEMLDARLPGSSTNPLLAELTEGKPHLKVLNKQDLADPARTEAWLAHFRAQAMTQALALGAGTPGPVKALAQACRELAPRRGGMDKPLRVMICGIPNVGKSTLINRMVERRAAKAADEAGVTRVEQKIQLDSGVYLYDTPGMLWPRIAIEKSGYHLAASGAVGRNAYEDEEVALALLASLRHVYAPALAQRYKVDVSAYDTEDDLLEAIGRKRAALLSGGRVNRAKAAELLLVEFRQGTLGRMTLESPEEFQAWARAAEAADAERAQKTLQRRLRRSGAKPPAVEDLSNSDTID
jgi:ribosome biogenesis GTPase A